MKKGMSATRVNDECFVPDAVKNALLHLISPQWHEQLRAHNMPWNDRLLVVAPRGTFFVMYAACR